MDTLDGVLMSRAYDWAFSGPVRRVFDNLVITGLSVAVAVVIGTLELGGLLAAQLRLTVRSGGGLRRPTSPRSGTRSSARFC
jgi:high-affinity nickel-transport protein